MTQRSTTAQNFIDGEIGSALSRAGLPHNHSIRALLNAEARIVGVREAAVRCDDQSIDMRIKELRNDSRYKHTFPQPTGKVAKSDMATLRANFEEIANGKIRVE